MRHKVIAYQGEPGAFSEAAAMILAGPAAGLLPCRSFADVFSALSDGSAAFAVVPYVNSLAGPVQVSCGLLAREPVQVLDELVLEVSHALIALPGITRGELGYVSSHPVALRQCAGFLRRNPGLRAIPAHDTAGAVAELVRSPRPGHAAIASENAARLYGAAVLERDIQDSKQNRTSFLLLRASV